MTSRGADGAQRFAEGTGRYNIGTVFSFSVGKPVNTLTAADLKRRGMAAIEEGLRRGPVHLVKRNKAAAVVLSEEQYARLTRAGTEKTGRAMSAIQWLLNRPAKGSKQKNRLDRDLRKERDSWT